MQIRKMYLKENKHNQPCLLAAGYTPFTTTIFNPRLPFPFSGDIPLKGR